MNSRERVLSDNMFEDSYGCRFRYMGIGLPYCIHSPLAAYKLALEYGRYDSSA